MYFETLHARGKFLASPAHHCIRFSLLSLFLILSCVALETAIADTFFGPDPLSENEGGPGQHGGGDDDDDDSYCDLLEFKYEPADIKMWLGVPNAWLPTVTSGEYPSNFAVYPALPPGFIMIQGLGLLFGDPKQSQPKTDYIIIASNSCTWGSTTISITVSKPPLGRVLP